METREWFDVVDEEDRVVGRELRSVVHGQGLRHRAVHILVRDPNGRILLQKRSTTKDMNPRKWDSSASGHLVAGETYDQAAVRELKEELDIALESLPAPCFKLPASEQTEQEFIQVYCLSWSGEIHPNQEEIERVDWFFPEEIDRWIAERPKDFVPAFLLIWQKYRSRTSQQTQEEGNAV